jgi:hypothetical protein
LKENEKMGLLGRFPQCVSRVLFLAGIVSLFVLSLPVSGRADDSQVVPVTSGSDSTSGNGSSSGSSSTYVDVHRVGAGLSWAPVEITPGATSETSVGYAGVRYWFNRSFGLDGGLGFGFPEVSPSGEFLTTLHVEPMVAILESSRTILYGNVDLMPGIVAGNVSSFAFQISAGIGVEHALEDMPRLALYGQWDPFSVNLYGPGNNNPTEVGVGFLGSVMNVDIGFRYYF